MRNHVRATACLALAALLEAALAMPSAAATKLKEKVFAEPREDQALVYFVRRGFLGAAVSMFVYADEQLLGVLDGSCYGLAYVDPGERLLWLLFRPDRRSKRVTLEAGRTYYFDLGTQIAVIPEAWGRESLEEVNAYCVPTEKETRTAQRYILKHHGEAERIADEGKGYTGTERQREAHVAQWAPVDLNPYSILCVEDFDLSDPRAGSRKKALQVESAPTRMADRVVEALEPGLFDQVLRGPMAEPVPGALVLKGDLTQYKPGSRWARSMMAGAGGSHLDFSVALLEADTGRELTRFGDSRTWAWGGAAGRTVGIEELERNVAYEIALYLKRCRQPG